MGFPGEKEADFEDSCSLVEECAFCKTHIFKYSKRPFTKAASIKGHVAPQVKNRRSDKLHEVGKKSAEAFFAANAGRTERVLLEEILEEQRMITGYTGNYIKVYVPYEDLEAAKGMLNQFVSVELSAAYRDGMRGRMV